MSTRDSNSRARGRIATVLASARASLLDPQRPITPQHIAQRDYTISKKGRSHPTVPSFSSSDIMNAKLSPIIRLDTEDDTSITSMDDDDGILLEVQSLASGTNISDLNTALTRLFQNHKLIHTSYSAEKLNQFMRLMFLILQTKALEDVWILCHLHLIKVLLYSDDIQTVAIMNFISVSCTYIQEKCSVLIKQAKHEILMVVVECLQNVLLLLTALQNDLTKQIESEKRITNRNEEEAENGIYFRHFLTAALSCLACLKQLGASEVGSKLLVLNEVLDRCVCETARLSVDILTSGSLARGAPREARALEDYSGDSLEALLLRCVLVSNGVVTALCSNPVSKKRLAGSDAIRCVVAQLALASHIPADQADNGYDAQQDLMMSVLRVTSRMSLMEAHRAKINGKINSFKYFASTLELSLELLEDSAGYPSQLLLGIISRLAFTLGNLTTTNSDNRCVLAVDLAATGTCISMLQNLSKIFIQEFLNSADQDAKYDEEDEDEFEREEPLRGARPVVREAAAAIVALLRLVANLCIEEVVGNKIGRKLDVLEMLADLLSCCGDCCFEELLLNTISTITNVTYYTCGSDIIGKSYLNEKYLPTLVSMSKFLTQHVDHENPEIVLESVKALGNLTRAPWVLDDLVLGNAYAKLADILCNNDSAAHERVIGVLINAAGHAPSRNIFVRKGEPSLVVIMISLLRKSALKNIIVSSHICKALFNMLAGLQMEQIAPHAAIGLQNISVLSMALFELIEIVEEMRDDVDSNKVDGKNYDVFYVTASSLYDLIDGTRYVQIDNVEDDSCCRK